MAMQPVWKCPHCGNTLACRAATGIHNYREAFGPPQDDCQACGRRYGTGRAYWRDMDRVRRRAIVGKMLLSVLLHGAVATLLTGMVSLVPAAGADGPFGRRLAVLFLACLVVAALLHVWRLRRCTRLLPASGTHAPAEPRAT